MAKNWEQGSWVFPVCFIWNKGKHFLLVMDMWCVWISTAGDNSQPSLLLCIAAAQARSQWHRAVQWALSFAGSSARDWGGSCRSCSSSPCLDPSPEWLQEPQAHLSNGHGFAWRFYILFTCWLDTFTSLLHQICIEDLTCPWLPPHAHIFKQFVSDIWAPDEDSKLDEQFQLHF